MLSTDKQTDKQTDRQTNQRYQKYNLLCQGGKNDTNIGKFYCNGNMLRITFSHSVSPITQLNSFGRPLQTQSFACAILTINCTDVWCCSAYWETLDVSKSDKKTCVLAFAGICFEHNASNNKKIKATGICSRQTLYSVIIHKCMSTRMFW